MGCQALASARGTTADIPFRGGQRGNKQTTTPSVCCAFSAPSQLDHPCALPNVPTLNWIILALCLHILRFGNHKGSYAYGMDEVYVFGEIKQK